MVGSEASPHASLPAHLAFVYSEEFHALCVLGELPNSAVAGYYADRCVFSIASKTNDDLMGSQEVRLETNTPARTTSLAVVAKDDAHVLRAVHQLYAIPMATIAPISLTTTLISSTATLKTAYHNTCKSDPSPFTLYPDKIREYPCYQDK